MLYNAFVEVLRHCVKDSEFKSSLYSLLVFLLISRILTLRTIVVLAYTVYYCV
jgi:hypothetical protein